MTGMTQQVEIIGHSQKSVTALGSTAGHGKAATNGLFTKLLALIGQGSTGKGASPKETALLSALDKPLVSASLTKKAALASPKISVADGEQKPKKEIKSGGQAEVSIAQAGMMAINTKAVSGALSEKALNPGQSSKILHTFLPVANKSAKQAAGMGAQAVLSANTNPGKASETLAAAGNIELKENRAQASDQKSVPSQHIGKHQQTWSVGKPDAGTTPLLTDKHLPYPGAKTPSANVQAGATQQSVLAFNTSTEKAELQEPALRGLISSGKTAIPAKVDSKEVFVANPLKSTSPSTAQQTTQQIIIPQTEKHEGEAKLAATAKQTLGEGISGRVATASQEITAGAGDKVVAPQHKTAPIAAKAVLGNLDATTPLSTSPAANNAVETHGKHIEVSKQVQQETYAGRVAIASQDVIASAGWKSLASERRTTLANTKDSSVGLKGMKNKGSQGESNSAHKASIQHVPSQQTSKQQHAATSAPVSTPLLPGTLADGSAQLADRSSFAGKYAQASSEFNALQGISSDASQITQAQSSKPVMPQTQTNSGPWSVTAAMQEIGRAASQERYRLELNLDPAHLGKIKVYLDSDANKQIQVHLVVDQNTSRQIIEQHLPALRQALAQHGLDMGGFSMDSQQNQDGQASASQHEQGDFSATASNTLLESAEPQKSSTNARLSIRV